MPKHIGVILAACALMAACASAPVVGTVVAERDIPAHDGTVDGVVSYIPQMHPVESCEMVGKVEDCSTTEVMTMMPIYGPVPHHWDEAWQLSVRDIKGKIHTVGVSQTTYDRLTTGSHFDSRDKS